VCLLHRYFIATHCYFVTLLLHRYFISTSLHCYFVTSSLHPYIVTSLLHRYSIVTLLLRYFIATPSLHFYFIVTSFLLIVTLLLRYFIATPSLHWYFIVTLLLHRYIGFSSLAKRLPVIMSYTACGYGSGQIYLLLTIYRCQRFIHTINTYRACFQCWRWMVLLLVWLSSFNSECNKWFGVSDILLCVSSV